MSAIGTLILGIAWPGLFDKPLLAAFIAGATAALIARQRHAPSWWQLIHLLFLPLAVMINGLHLPPWFWLGGFVLLLLVYWRTDSSQVPLYLSNTATAAALTQLIPAEPAFVVDLGCGTGGLLRHLGRHRPDCHFIGIEHAPIPFLISRWRNRKLDNVHIRHGDLWSLNLGACQLAYAFLSPVPMARLWAKACAEMEPGALLVSNSFAVDEVAPDQVVAVDDRRKTRLYCYTPGGGTAGATE